MENIKNIIRNSMVKYDVVIVGAGPAGLRCAEILSQAKKKVLLLEKNKEIGPKVCAGGLTRKSFRYLNLPEEMIEGNFDKFIFKTFADKTVLDLGENFLYTINRKKLGEWQSEKLKNSSAEMKVESIVTGIFPDCVEINNSEKIGYDFLVGADGSNSVVRRYLRLGTVLVGMAFQYIIPNKGGEQLEFFLDSKLFNSWYVWIFPHKEYTSVGYGYFPRILSSKKARENFEKWAKMIGIDLSQGEFQAHPINCDYRGHKFGNIFLAGDAAGLVSWISGEGIYQALVSGEEVAKSILDPDYKCAGIKEILQEKRFNNFLLSIVWLSGPFRDLLYKTVLWAVRKRVFARLLIRGLT